jgi:hypothetical protein
LDETSYLHLIFIKPTNNSLGRDRILGIEKNTLNWEKSGDKQGLNSLNTLVPKIFLEVSGDLGFGRYYPHQSSQKL